MAGTCSTCRSSSPQRPIQEIGACSVESRAMHKLSGRWKLGLAFAVVTAAFWGVLPIALTVVLRTVDPVTVTWLRFLTASLMLGAILAVFRQMPKLSAVGARGWVVLGLALFGLS